MIEASETQNKRVAKNTILLYGRTLYSLAVSLFTARIVLNALGEVDYGIYNVVGSVVTLFVFLRAAMANSTHRFVAFALGQGDISKLHKVYSVALIIHCAIAFVIVLLSESVGLWFFYEKIVIPSERVTAALWCYQFSVLTCALSVICVPYDAELIAHERMGVFAGVQVFNSTMNLVIAYLLVISTGDRLILYGGLLLCIQVINRLFYGYYCKRNFEECHFRWTKDRTLFKEMTSFAGWSLIGNLSVVGYSQGISVLLNMFFGPVVNAAVGVANQVQSALKGFVISFQTAVNPQITKSYAAGDETRLHTLIFSSSKLSFYLLLCMYIPVFMEAETILTLWLKNVPAHTVNFLRLILLITLMDTLSNPIGVANNATGKIKKYQIIEGGLLLTILPFAYMALKFDCPPEAVYVVQWIIFVIVQLVRVKLVNHRLKFTYFEYFQKVLLPISIVFFLSGIVSFLAFKILGNTPLHLITVSIVCVVSVVVVAYTMGITTTERHFLVNKGKVFLSKFKH